MSVNVRQLPPELLIEVFVWCLGGGPYDVFDIRQGPWVLGHVCARWRLVLLGSSKLWSCFRAEMKQNALHPRRLALLAAALSRSRRHDLCVCVDSYCVAHSPHLIQHSHRCRELTISLSPASIADVRGLKGRLPCLQSLTLTLLPPLGQTQLANETFSIAPALTELYLINRGSNLPWLNLPWRQLKLLSLAGFHVADVLCILRHTPALEKLKFAHALSLPGERLARGGVIELPSLRVLESCDPAFLEFINMPALETLDLSAGFQRRTIPALHVFLKSSHCHASRLRSLHIHQDSNLFHLSEALHNATGLEELHVSLGHFHYSSIWEFFWSLTRPTGKVCGPYLPKLVTFIFRLEEEAGEEEVDFLRRLFMDMVDSRSVGAGDERALRFIEIHLTEGGARKDLEQVRKLKRARRGTVAW